MQIESEFITPIITAFLAFFATWLSLKERKNGRRIDAAQDMINQLRDENIIIAKDLKEVKYVQHILEDYIGQLRGHIFAGLPPPPPAWPKELAPGELYSSPMKRAYTGREHGSNEDQQ